MTDSNQAKAGRARAFACAAVGAGAVLGAAVLAAGQLAPGSYFGGRTVDLRHLLGLGLVSCGVLLAFLRAPRRSALALALGIFACGPGWLLAVASPEPAAAIPGAPEVPDLRIGSANLLFGIAHPDPLGEWIHAEDLDVLALQEVLDSDRSKLNWPKILRTWEERFPHQWVIEHDFFGMALLSRIPFERISSVALDAPDSLEHGRPMRLDARLDWAGGTRVVVVHPPRPGTDWRMPERERFFADLGADLAADLGGRSEPLIVLGDFNATGASPLFRELASRAHLSDSRAGFGRLPSWTHDHLPDWFGLRLLCLDHILLRGPAAIERAVGPAIRSDHAPVHAVLTWGKGEVPADLPVGPSGLDNAQH